MMRYFRMIHRALIINCSCKNGACWCSTNNLFGNWVLQAYKKTGPLCSGIISCTGRMAIEVVVVEQLPDFPDSAILLRSWQQVSMLRLIDSISHRMLDICVRSILSRWKITIMPSSRCGSRLSDVNRMSLWDVSLLRLNIACRLSVLRTSGVHLV